jgi:ABC-2 type transport system permease protein
MKNFGIIFNHTLRNSRQSIFWWAFGLAVFGFFVAVIFPMISEFEEINELMANPVFQVILGDIEELDMASPEGFLGIMFFAYSPIVLAVYAVLSGVSIIGADEGRGRLDLLLSTPVKRWQVIVERASTARRKYCKGFSAPNAA